jgi:hypothetical protein
MLLVQLSERHCSDEALLSRVFHAVEKCLKSAFALFRLSSAVDVNVSVLALLIRPCQAAADLHTGVVSPAAASALETLFGVFGAVQSTALDGVLQSWDVASLPLACEAVRVCYAKLPLFSTRVCASSGSADMPTRTDRLALCVQQWALLALSTAASVCSELFGSESPQVTPVMLLECKSAVASVAVLLLRIASLTRAPLAAEVFIRLFSVFGDVSERDSGTSTWQLSEPTPSLRQPAAKRASSVYSPPACAQLNLLSSAVECLSPLATEALMPTAVDILSDLSQLEPYFELQRRLPGSLSVCVLLRLCCRSWETQLVSSSPLVLRRFVKDFARVSAGTPASAPIDLIACNESLWSVSYSSFDVWVRVVSCVIAVALGGDSILARFVSLGTLGFVRFQGWVLLYVVFT